MASAGPSAARTQGARNSSAIRATENAAARSVSAAASAVRRRGERAPEGPTSLTKYQSPDCPAGHAQGGPARPATRPSRRFPTHLRHLGRRVAIGAAAAMAVAMGLLPAAAAAAPPTVTIQPASQVGFTTAQAEGAVNPEGQETSCRFEYVNDSQFQLNGFSEPFSAPCATQPGSGSSAVGVQATLENLAPNTTYHLRLYAENSGVEPIETAEATAATFTTQATTPPTLSLTVTEVSYLKAHLAATIDPEGGNVNPIGGALPIAWELELSHEPLSEGWNIVPAAGQIKEAEAESNSPIDISADTPPLAPGTEYHARLVATGPGYEAISPEEAFTTLAVAKPTIENLQVGPPTAHTATFSAAVNPNASEAKGSTSPAESEAFKTHYRFECNPECPGLEGEVPAGNAPEAVSKEAAGLIPGHNYEVTLTATNAGGTETAGPLPFTTEALEPQIDATFLVAASETTANLGARVNPGGAATTVHFEYLSDAQFKADGNSFGAGTIATPESAAIGSDVEDHVAEAPIKGLAPNTAYRYRAVATNAKSPAGLPGPAETFPTRPPVAAVPCPNEALRQGPSAALPECRAFELVTPPTRTDMRFSRRRSPQTDHACWGRASVILPEPSVARKRGVRSAFSTNLPVAPMAGRRIR